MIDWNQVEAGETQIRYGLGELHTVIAIADTEVWLRSGKGIHYTFTKFSLMCWDVWNPWEDVTEACTVYRGEQLRSYFIKHNDVDIWHHDPDYRIQGMRVFKRKDEENG